jgi:hypothetical protein
MNKLAQQLGRLAAGVPKTLTDNQRAALRDRMAIARKSRWASEERTEEQNKPGGKKIRKAACNKGRPKT